MGCVKDWNTLFEGAFRYGEFEAMMSFVPYEEELTEEYEKKKREEPSRDRKGLNEKRERKRARYAFVDKNYTAVRGARESFFDSVRFFETVNRNYIFEEEANEALRRLYAEEEIFKEADSFWESAALENGYSALESAVQVSPREESFLMKDDMTVPRERVRRILDGVKKDKLTARKHEIKVEMLGDRGKNEPYDVDEILEKMTERLCGMMAKGSDGIYL